MDFETWKSKLYSKSLMLENVAKSYVRSMIIEDESLSKLIKYISVVFLFIFKDHFGYYRNSN